MSNPEYIEKWLNGTLSDEEKLIFEQTEEYKSLERLSKALPLFKAPDFDIPSEFQHLQATKHSGRMAKSVTMSWLKPLVRVAAVLILMAGVYFIFLSNPVTTITTQASEKSELFLPDSSAVRLNASSTLTYHKRNWESKRQVTLQGEAYFDVAKGSTFDVETEKGIVTVLGTQFNVKVRAHYFEVVCYEGLVQVKSSLTEIKLEPGRMLRIVNGVIAPGDHTVEPSPAWLAQESAFESVPIAEVFAEFERQYNVTLTTENVNLNQLFTGRFVHTDIHLALKSISIPLDLKYEIDEAKKTVVLSGEVN
jgi:transmembrane sensor